MFVSMFCVRDAHAHVRPFWVTVRALTDPRSPRAFARPATTAQPSRRTRACSAAPAANCWLPPPPPRAPIGASLQRALFLQVPAPAAAAPRARAADRASAVDAHVQIPLVARSPAANGDVAGASAGREGGVLAGKVGCWACRVPRSRPHAHPQRGANAAHTLRGEPAHARSPPSREGRARRALSSCCTAAVNLMRTVTTRDHDGVQ